MAMTMLWIVMPKEYYFVISLRQKEEFSIISDFRLPVKGMDTWHAVVNRYVYSTSIGCFPEVVNKLLTG